MARRWILKRCDGEHGVSQFTNSIVVPDDAGPLQVLNIFARGNGLKKPCIRGRAMTTPSDVGAYYVAKLVP